MSRAISKRIGRLAVRTPRQPATAGSREGRSDRVGLEGKRLVTASRLDLLRFTHQDLIKALRKSNLDLIDLSSARGKEAL